MSTKRTSAKKRTDRIATETEWTALEDRAGEAIKGRHPIGIDADGAIHFFARTTRQVAVFEDFGDTDPDVFDLRALPIPDTPRAWADHVCELRGPWERTWLNYTSEAELER